MQTRRLVAATDRLVAEMERLVAATERLVTTMCRSDLLHSVSQPFNNLRLLLGQFPYKGCFLTAPLCICVHCLCLCSGTKGSKKVLSHYPEQIFFFLTSGACSFSFSLARWARDQASHLQTKSLKDQTKTCHGQAGIQVFFRALKMILQF